MITVAFSETAFIYSANLDRPLKPENWDKDWQAFISPDVEQLCNESFLQLTSLSTFGNASCVFSPRAWEEGRANRNEEKVTILTTS